MGGGGGGGRVSEEVRVGQEGRSAYIIGVLLEELGLAHLGARELATDGRESVEGYGKAQSVWSTLAGAEKP